MYRLSLLCFFILTAIGIIFPACIQESNAQTRAVGNAIPILTIQNDSGTVALTISKLHVDINVVGNVATTTFDITFYNGLNKILEGEFDFPLADGQNISRYALDINGQLREGVVVEKAKARVAFENTARRGIDPGLAEKTKGNNFRTRIYPIPAKGYKRVVIGIEQTLGFAGKDLLYQLPLYSNTPIGNFSIKAIVLSKELKPVMGQSSLNNFAFAEWQNGWKAEYSKADFTANNTVAFTLPYAGGKDFMVFAEPVQNNSAQSYFYMNATADGQSEMKPQPASIVLLWDISASAAKRNIAKEIALIEAYVSALKNVSIDVIPFNIVPQPKETFTIVNGDASALAKRLKAFYFDGGTQLGTIDLNNYKADEILLFSDGLSTFGKEEMMLSAVPVTVINSSPSANFSYQKYMAVQSHGKFIDLTKTETVKAVEEMMHNMLHIVSIDFNKDEIEEVNTEPGATILNGFSMAGIVKKLPATITINMGFGNTITHSKTYKIESSVMNVCDNVKRIWASMKIAQLDLQYEINKAAITQLGKQFSIVTQNTSLLVLDRLQDYVEYEIEPPVEMRKEYYVLLKEKNKQKINNEDVAMKEAATTMKMLKNWWSKPFVPQVKNKEIPIVSSGITRPAPHPNLRQNGGNMQPAQVMRMSLPNRSDSTRNDNNGDGGADGEAIVRSYSVTGSDQVLQDVAITSGFERLQVNKALSRQMDEKSEEGSYSSDIKTNEWKSDANYIKALEATAADKYMEKYIELKKDYQTQPAFFVDVARFFFAKNNKALALQVLSNVCEMKLENAELLRIVANELLEAGEIQLAILTFKEVIKIREEDPQPYRDLALACNEAGQYNEAVELLYKVVTGNWDIRFRGVKSIAMNEMNAIIGVHPEVNITAIDKQFIVPMPVDVRIVIGWSSDNSDVDLWVTEPNHEKCYYQHALTEMGGRLSGDVTQGFGPEEYIIKKASNGSYMIEANLYGDTRQTLGGPITVKAELFTNFGRPSQKRKVINFRVTTNKEVVKIGELKFGN